MTAQDLHTIVAPFPEVVPVGLAHNERGWYVWRDEESATFACPVSPEAAADLIAGQIKRMLGIGTEVRSNPLDEPTPFRVYAPFASYPEKGATELEALIAAYKASKKPNV